MKQNLLRENFWINLTLIGLLWLSWLSFGAISANTLLDPSWTQALGYAFKQHFQAGVDYIFTFGPLGYLAQPQSAYDSDLFYLFMTWQLIVSLFLAIILVVHSHKIEGKIDKFIYFCLIIIVISPFAGSKYFLGIIAAITLAISPLPILKQSFFHYTLLVGTILLFLAVISLTKFTHFILVIAGVFSIIMTVWFNTSRRLALAIPLVFMLFFVGAWLISGQALANLPRFISNSLNLTSGYSEAMSSNFTLIPLILAIAIISLITLLSLLACLPKPWKFERFVIACLIIFGLFLVWKASFVRQGLHQLIFFTFALIAPFLLEYNHKTNALLRSSFRLLRYLVIFIAISGLFVVASPLKYHPNNFIGQWNHKLVNSFHTLLHLQGYKDNQEKHLIRLKQQLLMPNIRAQVGQSTVDIFSWGQGAVFLNEFNWHPRPVFQSYVAFTPELIAINGNFYASDKAPEFVIFLLQAIDKQFPWMNDSEALKIILRDYQPLLFEKGYLLLKRKPRGEGLVANGKTLLTQTININESLDIRALSHQPLLLHLEIQKSLLGQFYSLFYRLPEIYLEIGTTDDEILSYRIIPKMTQGHFVINPLIRNQFELTKWYHQVPLKSVASLRVVIKPDWLHYLFKSELNLSVSEFAVTPYSLHENFKVIR